MFQSDRPAILFAAINHHDDLSLPRGQLNRLSQCDEIRADLGQCVRSAFDHEKELDLR